jgi:hypothetical protein
MSSHLKRGSPAAERTSKRESWKVALELRLGTEILPVTGDGEEPLSIFEPATEVFYRCWEKRWYREITPFVLLRRMEFFIFQKEMHLNGGKIDGREFVNADEI